MRDELANLHLQLTSHDRSAEETADLAVKSFELPQALTARWLAADVRAKRQILEAVVLNFRMEGASLVAEMRKPFDLLVEGHFSHDGGGAGNRTRVRTGTREASTCVDG